LVKKTYHLGRGPALLEGGKEKRRSARAGLINRRKATGTDHRVVVRKEKNGTAFGEKRCKGKIVFPSQGVMPVEEGRGCMSPV